MEPDVSIPVKNNHSQDAVVVVLLVISNTETLQGSGSAELPPAPREHPVKRWPALRAVGHHNNLQVHHDEDSLRILVTTMLPTYTSARVSSTEKGVALRTSFTRSL